MYFPPLINKNTLNFLEQKKLWLFKLEKQVDQPFNLIFLKNLNDQIEKILGFLKSVRINNFELFYSMKANNAPFLVSFISKLLPVESSSPFETNLAFKNNPKQIIVNYPGNLKKILPILKKFKNLKTKVYLVINSEEQLTFLIKENIKIGFFIRLGNIKTEKFNNLRKTRFGIDEEIIPEIFKKLKKQNQRKYFKGLSFHIDSTSEELKREYLKKVISLSIDGLNMGFNIDSLDLGGGIRFNYISKNNWNELNFLISKKILENNQEFFWNNYNFGIIKKKERIFGEGNFFPYFSENNGTAQIQYLLDTEINGEKFSTILNDLNLKLIFELGRFILQDAGGSIFKIEQVVNKKNSQYLILNGKYNEIAANLDILYDPILFKNPKNKKVNKVKNSYFIFGNTCLEDDIFFKRKVYLPNEPEEEDLLFFNNTIAYKTKIFNNQFINGNKEINFYVDKNYQLIKKEIL